MIDPGAQAECIAVLGAGRSGLSAAALAKRLARRVVVLDGASPEKLAAATARFHRMGVETVFGEAASAFLDPVDYAVQSPGIDPRQAIVRQFLDRGIPVLGEIEFAFRHFDAPVVAITGTNGKTTTTEMVGTVLQHAGLRAECAGNYGVPFSEIVLRDDPQDTVALEVSSFQLELIEEFRPRVAVWLNFAPDHMDRYETIEEYRQAKARIFEKQSPEDLVVIQTPIAEFADSCPARKVTFSAFGAGDYTFADGWIHLRGERIFDFAATKLRGVHNAENVMAVLAIAQEFGISANLVAEALLGYVAPAHRCELVGEINGHEFINDSKATNLHALESSLRGQLEPVILIAGGKDKGLDFTEIRDALPGKVSHAVLIGQTRERIARDWEGCVPCSLVGSLTEAIEEALRRARPKQTILLSPGTSSFDMFASYEDRGDSFRREVQRLQTSGGVGREIG
jgi:UDP-N-acetylmuramoylalanine--D-glutamate ligase